MSIAGIWRITFFVFVIAVIAGCAGTVSTTGKSTDMLFKEGERLFAKGKYEDAITVWKRVRDAYQSPDMTATAEIKIADAQYENKNYIEAAAAYEDFRKLHPSNEKAPYALFRQAMSNFHQIGKFDTDQTAVKNTVILLRSFIQQYPDSENAAEARKNLENCRLRQIQYENYVGRFYLRTDQITAAIKRFEDTLKSYPDPAGHDETLYFLGQAYLKNGQKETARDTFDSLINTFPKSRYSADARKALK